MRASGELGFGVFMLLLSSAVSGGDVGREVGGVVFIIGPVSNARDGRLVLDLLGRGVSGTECS